jgi:hypothetical protein
LACIRLRIAIGRELDGRGITTPAAIGEALGMPAAEATSLLTRHQWREGDVARLEAAAARLGVQVPGLWPRSRRDMSGDVYAAPEILGKKAGRPHQGRRGGPR